MVGWIDWLLLGAGALLILGGMAPQFRRYRPLGVVAGLMMVISALYPRHGNALGEYLFGSGTGSSRLPLEIIGVAWWLLGARLAQLILDQLLRRTLFPNDNVPHARRLFADLASALIYVLAIVGIMDTVFKEPLSGVLATSGILAIVLGLALQNTLADVFSGLAINIEQPFGAGDWIGIGESVEGQIMEINWRATRIKTGTNDVTVIPNSVLAKAIVTNHSRSGDPYQCVLRVSASHLVSPDRVIAALQAAAAATRHITRGSTAQALARGFSDASINYEVTFSVDHYLQAPFAQSDVISRVVESFRAQNIAIGVPYMDIRMMQEQQRAQQASGQHESPGAQPAGPGVSPPP
jgi:small-conductance mechanosensitive channel